MMIIRTLIFNAVVLPLSVLAGINVVPAGTPVAPGQWNGNYGQSKAYAEANDLPLALVWGSTGCDHCTDLGNALNASAAQSWAAGQDVVFCYCQDKTTYDAQAAYEFAKTTGGRTLSDYPFVCLYWKDRAARNFTGRDGQMYAAGDGLFAQFKNSVETFVAEILSSPSYATFPFGGNEEHRDDRLEAIVGETTWVDVPIVRTNALDSVVTNVLTFGCGGKTDNRTVIWESGEARQTVRYPLPTAFSVSAPVTIALREAVGSAVLATRRIVGIEGCANGPKNPRWLGEGIEYGEWTMDIDGVTNLVARSGGHALVLIGGSCWCPDCAMGDEYLFDRQEFRDWAVSNKVALGVVDIPNDPTAEANVPSLLTYDSYRTSDDYVTLRGTRSIADEQARYQSGAGYLSRHSVEAADALAVIRRNRDWASRNTLNGGWNRPERANQKRPGVPILLALRPDGSICGRWNPFATTAPRAFHAGYLRRFEELFDQVGDVGEESNDDRLTTGESVATNAAVTASISAGDAQDVYRVEAPVDTRMVFTLTGSAATRFTLTVTDEAVTPSRTLADAVGVLSDTVCVTAKVVSSACFVKVSYPKDGDGFPVDADFAFTNESSTVRAYALATAGFASGGEIGFEAVSKVVAEGGAASSQRVPIVVSRRRGSAGPASVRVSLVGGGDGTRGVRYDWTDVTFDWAAGDAADKTAYLTVYGNDLPERDLTLDFALTLEPVGGMAADTELSPGFGNLRVIVQDDDVTGLLAYRQVGLSTGVDIVEWDEGASVSVRKLDGSAPSGLTVKVVGGRLVVSGVPSKAGDFFVSYALIVRKGGDVLGEQTVDLAFTVRDADFTATVPSLATVRTYSNLPVISEDGILRGLLTVTVPQNGRLSAKYLTGGRAYSYASAAWSEYDEGNSLLRAELKPVAGGDGVFAVTLGATGGEAVFDDPCGGGAVRVPLLAPEWSAANPADAWAGQYTVQLPQTNVSDEVVGPRLTGCAYMAMRMTNAVSRSRGAMLYAGVLPNGQTISGSSVLLVDGSFALMPFYFHRAGTYAPYAFSGEFAIASDPKTISGGRWSVTSRATPRWEVDDGAGRHTALCAVYGGYYDKDEISSVYESDSEDPSDLYFHVDAAAIVSGRHGEGEAVAPLAAAIAGNVPHLVGSPNPQRIALSFSPWTGVISGTLVLPFANGESEVVVYRGIALPGWQKCGTCSDLPSRPWAAGSCSFSDREGGRSFRSGCEVRLDRLEKGIAE